MQKNNTTCAICGKGYYLCMSCEDVKKLSPWKLYTDCPEHYKVFQIIKGYNVGVYSKTEAKNKLLNNVDLSDMVDFRDIIKEKINEIKSDDSKHNASLNNKPFKADIKKKKEKCE